MGTNPAPASGRVRKDVWKLTEVWDPALLWYARAITEMQARPVTNATSWRYQAAIHDYVVGQDPNARPGEAMPGTAEQRRFWRQCQHASWYFLPWHRMYLGYFERIVAATVVQLGGPAGWSLPYWNYSNATNPKARSLPPAFCAAKTPDGKPNPLRVTARVSAAGSVANNGDIIADETDVDLDCLNEGLFSGNPGGGNSGFGGPKTPFNHSAGSPGALEITPHGSMHVAVGGTWPRRGWMSSFNTAGLDPIFWLHHSNIDRLWSVWRKRKPSDLNPADPAWLSNLRFEFHDETGAIVTMTPSQVVDTLVSPFHYRYEDESDPLAAPVNEGVAAPPRTTISTTNMADQPIPEMVGATKQGLSLTGQTATTRLSTTLPTGPALESVAGGARPRVYLNIENVKGMEPESYLVYINLPEGAEGAKAAEHRDLLAGTLSMFGLPEASGADSEHPGDGLHYTLEISKVVDRLEARNAWDPADIRVTFVPRRPRPTLESVGGGVEPPPIQVGRVSLYFAK